MLSNYFLDNPNRLFRKLCDKNENLFKQSPACYIIENIENGYFYVGSTRNILSRAANHSYYLNKNKHSNKNLQEQFNNCFNKDNFIIHVCPTENIEDAIEREQLILDEGFNSGILLNISDNARTPASGYDRSEVIRKLTEFNSLPEIKHKTSLRFKRLWENTAFRNNIIDKNGEKVIVDGIEYLSVREASRKTNITIQTLRREMVNGQVSSSDCIQKSKKKVSCEGSKYETVKEAANAYGIKANTMTYRLKSSDKKWDTFVYFDE